MVNPMDRMDEKEFHIRAQIRNMLYYRSSQGQDDTIYMEETILLFTDDMTVYIENTKKYIDLY
jgi:hypothetical protein